MPTAYNATRHGMRPAYNSLKIRGIAKGGLSQCKRPPFSVQYMAFRDAIHGLSGCNRSSFTIRHAPHQKKRAAFAARSYFLLKQHKT